MELSRHIGARIAALRKTEGLSQAELAARSGVSPRQMARVEAGGNPSLATLAAIAGALGVPVATLFPRPRAPEASRTAKLAEAAELLADDDLAAVTALVHGLVGQGVSPAAFLAEVFAELRGPAGER